MDRDAGMLRTSQHQLECEIDQRADADCHVTLTTDYALPPSIARQSMRTRRSVSAACRNGKRGVWRSQSFGLTFVAVALGNGASADQLSLDCPIIHPLHALFAEVLAYHALPEM